MICYDKLWVTMFRKGITRYRLKEDFGIDGRTIKSLSDNRSVTTATLNKLCAILSCAVEDIMEYKPDDPPIYGDPIIKPARCRRTR